MKPKDFRGFISSRDTIIKTWGGRAKARREYELRNNKGQVMVRAVQLPATPAETSIVKPANWNEPLFWNLCSSYRLAVASNVSIVSHSKTKVSQLSQVPGTWWITEQTDRLSGQYFSTVSSERRTHSSDMDTGAGAVADSPQVLFSLGYLSILYIYYRPMK